ncbi:hypothetical protein MTP99_010729 [Tenebrio molitor]|nr:hypothetical protein MTP99_010729 [Tenebrio molitor]
MYLKSVLFISIIFYSQFCFIKGQKDLPAYYPRCYRDDPNINQCLLKATEQVKPFLQKGVPELNLPPISPFHIPEINLQQGTNVLSYKDTLTNVVITGLDNYKFRQFDFDVKNLFFNSSVEMGFLNIKSNYSIKGKLLTVPIEGVGTLNTNITNSNGTLTTQAKLVTRKGISYMDVEKSVVKLYVGDVQTDYTGLFDQNEVLAKAAKQVINENLKEIIDEVKPALEEVFVRIANDVLFKSVLRIPYDKLYPLHQ